MAPGGRNRESLCSSKLALCGTGHKGIAVTIAAGCLNIPATELAQASWPCRPQKRGASLEPSQGSEQPLRVGTFSFGSDWLRPQRFLGQTLLVPG